MRAVTEQLTIDETGPLLRLSDETVCELVRRGSLPGAAKISGKWRIDRDKLRAWIPRGGELAEDDHGHEGGQG